MFSITAKSVCVRLSFYLISFAFGSSIIKLLLGFLALFIISLACPALSKSRLNLYRPLFMS